MKPIIEIKGLSKRYQLGEREPYYSLRDEITRLLRFKSRPKTREDFWALSDINLSIEPGEAIGIIGRNGAGKSTLLKVLSQITPPTKGTVKMRGRVASLLEVGTGFHPELTGRENIFLNGAILGMSQKDIRRNFNKIVEFSETAKFIDTPVKRYSSGMYVRLAFAVAAHLEPEILIVDEVLAVGDAAFQKKCLGKMEDIGKQGRTVLFVSHNMSSVQSLCKKGLWLDQGKIMQVGEMSEVVTNYLESTANASNTRIASNPNDPFVVLKVVLKNATGRETTDFNPGEDLIVEVHYVARDKTEKPSFWLAVSSNYGPAFMASMMYDGFRPNYLKGKGVVSCRFKKMPLLPGFYSISMGIRQKNIFEDLFPTKEVGLFNVNGDMKAAGFNGENADQMLSVSTRLVIPYQWTFPNGQTGDFKIKSTKAKKDD